MPSRNLQRLDADNAYYHVYSRGVNKAAVFESDDDKSYFLYLLARHLSREPANNSGGYTYPHYRGKVELLTYCIMDNHFHLMLYQVKQGNVTRLMRSVLTAYTAYYNQQHGRRGPLFESRYKSSHIDNDAYLIHVSRYIHLNPRYWRQYPYSSFRDIYKQTEPEWLQPERVLAQHGNDRSEYNQFVSDYKDNKQTLASIKYQLADQA